MSAPAPLALGGVRVLDLSRGGATAACARLLGQLGAVARTLHPAALARGTGADLGYDVVLCDLRPGEAAALGLEPSALLAPGRVVVSTTTYGLDGPAADRPGPLPAWASFGADVDAALVGAHAAVAALAALRWARQHGRGVLVEVAALEVVAACLGDRLPCPRAEPSAGTAARVADRLEPGGPTGRLAVLACADGYVGLTLPSVAHREDLAALTGVDVVRDERGDLASALGGWLAARTRAEVVQAAQLWRLPVVAVLEPAEVLADEQSAVRRCWGSDGGRVVACSPFRLEGLAFPDAPNSGGERAGCYLGASGALQDWGAVGPLADVRVLDLGVVWAGPYCGRLLAGLGAEVIKIERPTRPDGTRAGGRGDCPGVFADLNRGKASVVLDLARPAGRDAFLRLACQAGVVVENFSPRVMPNLGLDRATLAAANPRLLVLSLPAFGSDGPWRDYVAYGSGLELATGLAAWSPDGRPEPAPVPYLDFLAGAYGAAGLLAVLLARDGTGEGAYLEVAQREVACQVLASALERGERRRPAALAPAALAADPHLAARGLFAAPASAAAPCHHYARLPWRLHGVQVREPSVQGAPR